MSALLAWQVWCGLIKIAIQAGVEQEKQFWALLEQLQASERETTLKLHQAGIGTDPYSLFQLLAVVAKQLAARGVDRGLVVRAILELGGDL